MGNCSGSLDPRSIASAVGVSRNCSSGGRRMQGLPDASSSRKITSGSVIGMDFTGEESATRSLKIYSFNDLKIASGNFNRTMVLGVGGFGTVYRGWLEEKTLRPSSRLGTGMMVAIKKLNPRSLQGFEEWQTEVNFLGMLSHPNLVQLLGFCWEQRELILVYEYVENGSLEDHLFRRNAGQEPFSWDLRLKIAIGAARGLAFLHDSGKEVIYRDFKTSNILLDENYNAKISDFGLARLGPSGSDTHVTTRVMGTLGYAAPEYISTGHLSVKSDVYGFGVVLLEMMTGLRSLDKRRPRGQQNLVDWMQPLLWQKRNLKNIIDEQMEGQYSPKAASEAAHLTRRCLATDPKKRPSMADIVECLEGIAAMSISKDQPPSSSHQNMLPLSPRAASSPPYQNFHRSNRSPRHLLG